MKSNIKKLILFIVAVTLIFLIISLFSNLNTDKISSLLLSFEFSYIALLVYFFLYIGLVLFGFPSSILTLSAGFVFGIGLGWVIDFTASMVTAVIAFYITRFARHKKVSLPFMKKKFETAKKSALAFEKYCEDHGFKVILLFRFSMVPFIVVSYSAGMIKTLKFRYFLLATIISNSIFGFIVIVLGDSLRQSPLYLGVTLIISILIIVFSFSFFNKKLRSDFK